MAHCRPVVLCIANICGLILISFVQEETRGPSQTRSNTDNVTRSEAAHPEPPHAEHKGEMALSALLHHKTKVCFFCDLKFTKLETHV